MIRVLLLTTALASGAGSAWMVGGLRSETPQPQVAEAAAAVPVSMEEVLVATRPLERGAKLLEDDVRWHPWPKDALTEAFIIRAVAPNAPAELAGSVLRGRIPAGAPLPTGDLAPVGSNLLAAVLAPGMRAVAIAISAEKTAGGFILPEDRVDVVLAMPCRTDNCQAETNARTILRNVRVLAIDQSGGETDSGSSLIGKTATLELNSEQAEKLVGAEASGALSLVLRASVDHSERVEDVQQAAPAPVEEPRRSVRVWRGGVAEDVVLLATRYGGLRVMTGQGGAVTK